MNWEDVRFFLATAQQGSYSAAATLLKVSHTTVARRVQVLEQQLQVKLVERYGNKVRITEAGEHLRLQAEQAQQHLVAVERQIAGLDTVPAGSLRVTAPYLLCHTLLPEWIAAFQRDYPDIELELVAAFSRFNLHKREADLALRLTNQPPETLHGRKLAQITWSLAIRADEAEFWKAANIKPILGDDDERVRPTWLPDTVGKVRVSQRFNDPFLHLGAVSQGTAAGLVPDFWRNTQSNLVQLCAVPKASCDLWILTHQDLRQNARIRAFFDQVGAQATAVFGNSAKRPDLVR
ncbi:LysR family transcriptional regulator [Acanthopleuribacter pedis]|uniref:LysR family transcriptional regulator n=1 Tax=Acanthopleuribacter pedis TaxID=442870 RepID=A0A8J7U6T9_9BACT|nr:LysR family transcriptional regulator [Acanthopleuribacter pedis]MBO1320721.1 LysR family transcriptional regulator [Acanthopleuribacter pedis]